MENKNIVITKHHPRPLTLSNSFYLTQCPEIIDMLIKMWYNKIKPTYTTTNLLQLYGGLKWDTKSSLPQKKF